MGLSGTSQPAALPVSLTSKEVPCLGELCARFLLGSAGPDKYTIDSLTGAVCMGSVFTWLRSLVIEGEIFLYECFYPVFHYSKNLSLPLTSTWSHVTVM